MRNHPTIIHNRVPIRRILAPIPIVHDPLLPLLLVIWAPIIRAAMNDWKFLAVLAHFRRAFFGELEFHAFGLIVRVFVWVFCFWPGVRDASRYLWWDAGGIVRLTSTRLCDFLEVYAALGCEVDLFAGVFFEAALVFCVEVRAEF